MTQQQAQGDPFPGIEVLRGFAALAVIGCHLAFLGQWSAVEQHHALWYLASYGWAGVDLFFVISGFVITRSALRLRERPDFGRRFWLNRVARIYPLYVLSSVAFLLLIDSSPVTGPDAAFQILTHLLMLHAFFPSTSASINPVTWTLGIEMWLYGVAFVLVWQRLITSRNAWRWALAGFLVVLAYRTVIHVSMPPGAAQNFYILQLPGMLDGFLLGAAFAALPDPLLRRIPRVLLIASVALLSVAAWWWLQSVEGRYWDNWHSPVLFRSLLSLLAACALLWALQLSTLGVFGRLLAWMGQISYGLYLWHHMIILMLVQAGWTRWELVGAALCLTIAVAWMSYRGFERPVQSRLVRGWMAGSAPQPR